MELPPEVQKDIEHVKATYDLRDADVILFPYGSRVYGTQSPTSDYDFLAVIPPSRRADTGTEYRWNNVNFHFFNKADFQSQLDAHKIHTLEAYFLPGGDGKKFRFKLDLPTLRHELSQKASHSFVKAKKKIEVEKDFYTGWKSLFHSLRILVFGIQIAKTGKIEDYSAANSHWKNILNAQQYNWDYFKDAYQPIYNHLATEFRKHAPKEMP